MDNSQDLSESFDIFSEASECDYSKEMDVEGYETVLSQLKASMCSTKTISSEQFNGLLQNSRNCIEQCLNTVAVVLDDSKDLNRVCCLIDDAVSLLQMLSNSIKRVLETIPFVCCGMKTFSITTGHIILTVFNHCKNSECLYGVYINMAEKQLKDLFRTCHELQITYLMIMENHYVFDLSESEQLNILLEALDINLKIGEVIQDLDVKTMAEQFKAFMALCEKYSKYLQDKDVHMKCNELLCELIVNNMKNVIEIQDENEMEKLILRRVMVTAFHIKILLRLYNIFKSARQDYDRIVKVLIFLHIHNKQYLEVILQKSSKVTKIIEDKITPALDNLLAMVLTEGIFIKNLCEMKAKDLENESYFGYIILLTSIMKVALLNSLEIGDMKVKIVKTIFDLLPNGHTWFNIKFKFHISNYNLGLFEYMLTVCFSYIKTFNSEQYIALERILFNNLLKTDCYAAIFASNLWILLLKSGNQHLITNTLSSLFKVYHTLVQNNIFHTSPQKIFLLYTIRNIFQFISDQEKVVFLKNYSNEDFVDVWASLKLSKLTNLQTKDNIGGIVKKMYKGLKIDENNEFANAVEEMSSLQTITKGKNKILEILVKAWNKVDCCKCNVQQTRHHKTIERLVQLTESVKDIMPKQVILKITSSMASILKSGNTENVLLIFRKFCNLYENVDIDDSQENFLMDILYTLLEKDEIKQHLISIKNTKISDFIAENYDLRNAVQGYNYLNYKDITQLKDQLMRVENCCFSHKCEEKSVSKGRNFELNIDSFFDDDEPCNKKLKFDENEVEDLVKELENNVSHLTDKKTFLSDEQRCRISNVCSELKNIADF